MTGGASMTDATRALAEELLNERFKRQPEGQETSLKAATGCFY